MPLTGLVVSLVGWAVLAATVEMIALTGIPRLRGTE